MSYAPIDDQLNVNAKILGLTNEEFRLWVAGLAWTYQHNRKGSHVIPEHIAIGLAGMHRLQRPDKIIGGLVSKRAWDAVDGGFTPHDADEHDKRDRVSQLRAEAGSKGGQATQAKRKQNAKQNAKQNPKQTTEQNPEQNQARAGYPEPVPTLSSKELLSTSSKAISQAVAIWNSNCHPNQPKAVSATGARERDLRAFLVAIGWDMALWQRAVQAFAASRDHNGTGDLRPFSIETMIAAKHRSKWIDAGHALAEKAPEPVMAWQEPEPEGEIVTDPAEFERMHREAGLQVVRG